MSKPIRRLVRPLGAIGLFALLTVAAFAVVEGLASLTLLGYELTLGRDLRSYVHQRYDSVIGWVNTPGFHLPDMYGPGVGLEINAQSLRNRRDLTPEVPEDRIRVLCVGDSFTLGLGVSNDQTWCHELERIDPRLETFNLGESGYGLGQAYLKFRRLSAAAAYDVVVFAFIEDSFWRMQTDRYALLYPKPRMTLVDGQLVPDNIPVPRFSRGRRWLIRHGDTFERLRVVTLGRRVAVRVFGPPTYPTRDEIAVRATALAIFQGVMTEAEASGAQALFVYIPQAAQGLDRSMETWRRYLEIELPQRQFPYLDMVGRVNRLPFMQQDNLFDPFWKHYSPEGNRYMAEQIHAALLAQLPDRMAARTGEDTGPASGP